MKLPRDVSGADLAKRLSVLGYRVVRTRGSHIRLTTLENGEHHVAVPLHKPLRVGMLSAILLEVANHFDMSVRDLVSRLEL